MMIIMIIIIVRIIIFLMIRIIVVSVVQISTISIASKKGIVTIFRSTLIGGASYVKL